MRLPPPWGLLLSLGACVSPLFWTAMKREEFDGGVVCLRASPYGFNLCIIGLNGSRLLNLSHSE